MKIFKTIKTEAILLLLLALGIASLSLMAMSVAAQTDKSESHHTWEWSEDGWRKRVEIRGKAEFTDDYTDIKSVSEGGSVRIEEVRDGTARRMDILPDANGQLRRTYYVNGQARALDEQARAWLASIMLQAVRQNAFDADKRIQKIFEQRGLGGVLEEISLAQGDYVKRIYFGVLIKNRNLSASALQSVLREAARQIASDYEKATLLIAASEIITYKNEALPAFFEATTTIKSDYEHRRVLSTLLKRSDLGQEVLSRILESAARMSSDYEKATLLLEASKAYKSDERLRSAFLQTVETIKSDYERGRVLSSMLKNKEIK